MEQVLVTEQYIQDASDAIRQLNGLTTEYLPSELATAILALPVSAPPTMQEISVTENGIYTPQAGYGGISKVTVNVPEMVYIAEAYNAKAESLGKLKSGRASTVIDTTNYILTATAAEVTNGNDEP